jgi:hypothetical protein
MSTTVFSYDEGVRTFKIVLQGNKIDVYKTMPDTDTENNIESDEESDPNRLTTYNLSPDELGENVAYHVDYDPYKESYPSSPNFTFIATRIFIKGEIYNTADRKTLDYGEEDEEYLSLLLEIDPEEKQYVWIGWNIIKFKTISPVVQFNSVVSYYDCNAIDQDGNYYLMYALAVMKHSPTLKTNISKFDGPHQYYHRNCIVTDFRSFYHTQGYNPREIVAFYVNGVHRSIHYDVDAKEDYKSLLSQLVKASEKEPNVPQEGAYIKNKDNEFVPLPLEKYLEIIQELANAKGFLPMNAEVLSKRFSYY